MIHISQLSPGLQVIARAVQSVVWHCGVASVLSDLLSRMCTQCMVALAPRRTVFC
jgi:hypothetical protein